VLAEQRQNQILRLVNDHQSISVMDIQQRLNVSRETIRRDLLALEEQQKLRRAHGGAIALQSSEPEMVVRFMSNPAGKRAIGKQVAEMIPDGAAVILAGGTTVQCVSTALADKRSLTVITNCVASCLALSGRNGSRVHMLGGELQPQNQSTLGRDATQMLSNYFADFAVVGTGAISPQGQLMDYSREEAELHGLMLRSAQTVVIVADHQKFGRVAPVRVQGFELASVLVTDAAPEGEMAAVLKALPVQVFVAGPT
jgi:DeoR family transcriptional regulator, glycerol-3-phosphate regulon repressor